MAKTPSKPTEARDDHDDVEAPAIQKTKPNKPSVSTATVTVACKIPTGLQLQLQKSELRAVDAKDGPVRVPVNVKRGKVYFVYGPAVPVGTLPKGFPLPPIIVGGYALTAGIPADFWDEWFHQNQLAPYVAVPDGAEHGMVFAYDRMEDATAAAREQEKLLSGLEPISTDIDEKGRLTDPRMPRPFNMSVAKIGFEDRNASGEA